MEAIDLETRYSAHNYEPLPVVLARGRGSPLAVCKPRVTRAA